MSEAPERIWADMDGCWWDKPYGESPEYVRCDMLQEIFARYSRVEADRIEELEADNARLETEAKLQAEEIDKTRRRADKWQSMVLDCGEYLKPGETPAERIEREINDCLALMKLLEKKQMRIEELEAKLAKAVEALRWQADIINDSLTGNEVGKHRILLDGEYHEGPVVNWVHKILTGFEHINRATIAKLTGGKDE